MFPILTEHASGARVLSAEIERTVSASQSHRSWVAGNARPEMGRETDACFDRNAARALGTGIAELVPLNEEIVIEMDMLVGPLLERNGGYGYDTFTVADGLRRSFWDLPLDAARYDPRAAIAEDTRRP